MKKIKEILIFIVLILLGYFLFVPELVEQNKEEWSETGETSIFETLYPN